jgi:hypothetical protein
MYAIGLIPIHVQWNHSVYVAGLSDSPTLELMNTAPARSAK